MLLKYILLGHQNKTQQTKPIIVEGVFSLPKYKNYLNLINLLPLNTPKDIFGSKKQKTPQEEGF
jgi:hypothetical protein